MKIRTPWAFILALAVGLGVTSVYAYRSANPSEATMTGDLAGEFWNVDLIVKGKVVEEGDSFKKDASVNGKMPFKMDITPAFIEVDQVIYGHAPGETIMYLQHGSASENKASESWMQLNDEVILILTGTENGRYWSYNFDDGIWKVKNGKVYSTTSQTSLQRLVGSSEAALVNEIRAAAVSKKKSLK